MLESPKPTAELNDPCCLGEGEARRLLAGSPWHRMVVLGDGRAERRPEATEGYLSVPWPTRVADALREVDPRFACLDLLNARVRQAAQVRSRQLPEALAFGGDLAVVHLSGHDLLGPGLASDAVRTELTRIIAPLRERGYDVVLMDPFDLTRSAAGRVEDTETVRMRQRARTKRSRALALRHGALHVDLSEGPPERGAGVWGGIGTALNGRGHAVTAAAVVRALGGMRGRSAGSAPGSLDATGLRPTEPGSPASA
ncbi:SGNH/GDSL hydrolase family protein [Streptomyces sp. QTS137]